MAHPPAPGQWPVELHDDVLYFDDCPASKISDRTLRWLGQYARWKQLEVRPQFPSARYVQAMLTIEAEFARLERNRLERIRRRRTSRVAAEG